jgi:hypothetical protein
MPVTSVGTIPVRRSEAAPAAVAPAALPPLPEVAPTTAAGPVGHGVTRLKARPPAYALPQPFIPGTPPPKRESAGAHGAHKGRISIR